MIETNSVRAWLLAARPKTLAGAAGPVIMALCASWADLRNAGGALMWVPAVLCLLFALLMQVDANFVNDYFDFKKGRDERGERLGPPRACTEGWITPQAMGWGIGITTALSCLTGLPLVVWGGWWMVAVGMACVVFCFLYTTLLAGLGLGDVLVLIFFGLVPVCATYFIQTGTVTLDVVLLSVGMGMATDCLLVVNNYRDREQDHIMGKRTIVVLLGERFAEWLYLLLGIIAVALPWVRTLPPTVWSWEMLIPTIYLIPHSRTWLKMKRLHSGRELNSVLGQTAANILLFAILESVALIIHIQ